MTAARLMLNALCFMLYTLCSMLYALCSMLYALSFIKRPPARACPRLPAQHAHDICFAFYAVQSSSLQYKSLITFFRGCV
jgi:hypothetical protein